MTAMLNLIRVLTILVVVVTILGLVALKSPNGPAAVTAALGSCSFEQIRQEQRLPQLRREMLERSQKVRDDGKYQIWSTPQGEFYYLGPPTSVDALVLAEEELDIYGTARIKPGSTVLDCGANYGTFTRRALERGAAKVIAIEINPDSAESIRRTFANEIRGGRVIVYAKGVWDKETELDLRGDSVVMQREGPPIRLPVTTIDRIISELHLSSVDFIKMDIEGAEKNALRGAKATLAKYTPALAISSEHLPDDVERIPALVNELVPGRYRTEYAYCLFDRPFHAKPNALHFSR